MPDRRQHRGPHPEDGRLFDLQAQQALRPLDHGYPHDSALKLVGDRYALVARQRIAISRCSCSNAAAARRRRRQVNAGQLRGAILRIDGYNVLTTIKAALAGGVILDRCAAWFKLAKETVAASVPNAWVVGLEEQSGC
jgi:hypothetical protein